MPDYTPLNVIGARSPLLQQARQAMALRMLQSGMSTAPIQSPLQGVARMAQSFFGGMALRRLADHQKAGTNAFLNGIFSSGGAPTTTPAPVPSVAPQSGPSIPPEALSPTPLSGSTKPISQPSVPPEALSPQPMNSTGSLSGGLLPQTASAPSAMQNYAHAISANESGGNYGALGPVTRTGDRAYGKYQVMGANIPQWTAEVLGHAMTPQQFLASPQAQDAVFKAKFGQYVQKYGPEGASRAWFAGEGGMNNPNARDALGTSVAQYAKNFLQNLGPTQAQAAEAPNPNGLQYPNLAAASDAQKLFGPVPIGKTTPSGLNFPNTVSAPQALAFNGTPQPSNPLSNVQAFAPQPAPMPQPSAGGFQPAPLPHTVEMMRTQPVQLPIGGQPVARQQVPERAQGGTFGVPPRVQHLIRSAVTSGNPQLQAMGWKMLGNYLAPKGYDLKQLPDGSVVAFEKGNPSNSKVVYSAQNFRPLITPQDRARYGISPNDTRPFEIGPNGKLYTPPNGTSVTVNNSGETSFEKAYGKGLADEAATVVSAGDNAATSMQKDALLGRLLTEIDTGKLTPALSNMGAWMQAAGINPSIVGIDPKMPATAQAINGLANSMILGKIGKGGFPANNFSEQDRKFMLTQIPQLSDTPQAAKLKLEVDRRLNQLAIEKANRWAQARSQHKSFDQFQTEWRQYMSHQDLFGDLIPALTAIPGGNQVAPSGTMPVPQQQPPIAPPTSRTTPSGFQWSIH